MPTNPQSPINNAAIDRLSLGIDSPRGTAGTEPAYMACPGSSLCFEAEGSSVSQHIYFCFDAEPSSLSFMCGCGCFEAE